MWHMLKCIRCRKWFCSWTIYHHFSVFSAEHRLVKSPFGNVYMLYIRIHSGLEPLTLVFMETFYSNLFDLNLIHCILILSTLF